MNNTKPLFLPLIGAAICFSAVCLPGQTAQAQTKTTLPQLLSYQQALEKAAADKSVAIVVLHGSDWNPLGEKLLTDVLPKFESQPNVVLADVNQLQNPTERESESNQNRNQGWPGGKWSVPAVFAYGPDGKQYGVRSRLEIYDDSTTPQQVIETLIENSQKRLNLEQQIALAEKNNDSQTGLKLLSEMMELPLDRPDIDPDRIAKLDPQDEWGIVARLKFPDLYSMMYEATREAKGDKSKDAVARYTSMLQSDIWLPEQRAQILLALATVQQHTDGQADAAKKAFQDAVETAPESVAGKIAAQRLEQFFPGQ